MANITINDKGDSVTTGSEVGGGVTLDRVNPTDWNNDWISFGTVFTPGSVVFASPTGGVAQDNGKLFFDDTHNRLGVGIGEPAATLHAVAITEQLRIGYDVSNYWSATVDSAGALTLSGTGSGRSLIVNTDATFNGITIGSGAGATQFSKIHAFSSSDQFKIGYDVSNYWTSSVGSTGDLTLTGTGSSGNISIAPAGKKIYVVGDILSTGTSWTSRASAADNNWMSVTYGNGLFVAVSSSGSGNRVMTSPDGINWSTRSSAVDNDWYGITYGNGLFVAVSYNGSGDRVMTSPDGITWTSRVSASNNNWHSVAYGNGIFVAVATSGTGDRVMTSPDGIKWTSRTSAADNGWITITFGNGLFVAVANSGTGNRVMTSSDGITWTSRTSTADNPWYSVAYGNGIFVAVAYSGTGNSVMTSPDGINWTSRASATETGWLSVTYGDGLFVAVAYTGTGNRVMTSPDGITWTSRASAENNTWNSIVFGNGIFVSVSDSGTGNRVMTSGKAVENHVPTKNIFQGGMTINGIIGSTTVIPTIASGDTVVPITRTAFVSGTTTINTITVPTSISAGSGQITLIPTGLWSTGTSGNIALATTAVVSKALILTYDSTTTKWYPSY